MTRIFLTVTTLLFSLMTLAQTKTLSGFSPVASSQEFALEEKFDSYLDAKNIDSIIKTLSARPHQVGSPGGKLVADYISRQFRNWGFDVQEETFYTLFPTPKERLLEMEGPKPYKALLAEPSLKEDATSGQTREQLPTYNCWSPDGDVTGEL